MTFFFAVAVVAFIIYRTYAQAKGKELNTKDEDRGIWMTFYLLLTVIAVLFLFAFISVQYWTEVAISLIVACICGLAAFFYYVHHQ